MAAATADIVTKVVLSLTSLYVGYRIGSRPARKTDRDIFDEDEDSNEQTVDDSLEDKEGIEDGDLASIKAWKSEPCKMVLVVRTDLKMKPGDISCQCAKATLACFKILSIKNSALVRHWEITGQAKIALKAKSEEELMELEGIAKSLNLCVRAVHDE